MDENETNWLIVPNSGTPFGELQWTACAQALEHRRESEQRNFISFGCGKSEFSVFVRPIELSLLGLYTGRPI